MTVPLIGFLVANRQEMVLGRVRLARCQADIVQHVLEKSDHVLTQDIERETVYTLVSHFIAARTA